LFSLAVVGTERSPDRPLLPPLETIVHCFPSTGHVFLVFPLSRATLKQFPVISIVPWPLILSPPPFHAGLNFTTARCFFPSPLRLLSDYLLLIRPISVLFLSYRAEWHVLTFFPSLRFDYSSLNKSFQFKVPVVTLRIDSLGRTKGMLPLIFGCFHSPADLKAADSLHLSLLFVWRC